jgi:hypothetical protein
MGLFKRQIVRKEPNEKLTSFNFCLTNVKLKTVTALCDRPISRPGVLPSVCVTECDQVQQ